MNPKASLSFPSPRPNFVSCPAGPLLALSPGLEDPDGPEELASLPKLSCPKRIDRPFDLLVSPLWSSFLSWPPVG